MRAVMAVASCRSSAAAEILNLLKAVEALPKHDLPPAAERYRGPSPKGAVGDLIRVLLKAVSEEHGVAARILATSDDIDALVLDDDADVPALRGWRRKLFGEKALAIKHGRIGLAATRKGVVEIPIAPAAPRDARLPETRGRAAGAASGARFRARTAYAAAHRA